MLIVWYLLIALAIMALQGLLFRLRGLKRIRYTRYFSKATCFEGDVVYMVEQVTNRSLIPLPWLRLESRFHAALKFGRQTNLDVSEGEAFQNHRSLFSMAPYSRITRRHVIRCLKRGVYRLETISMSTGDVLGMFQASRTIEVESELVVYPKAWDWRDVPLPSHSWQGDIVVKRWILEDPFMISGVREYRPGDSLKGINWKATARAGRMLVHNRDFTSDHRLMICVNTEEHEKMWNKVTDIELVEREIHYAATIAEHALARGIETGYCCNGHLHNGDKRIPVVVPASCGDAHREKVLHAMASTVIALGVPYEELLVRFVREGRSNTDYVLITPHVSRKIEGQIKALRLMGNSVAVLELPVETTHAGDAVNMVDTADPSGSANAAYPFGEAAKEGGESRHA